MKNIEHLLEQSFTEHQEQSFDAEDEQDSWDEQSLDGLDLNDTEIVDNYGQSEEQSETYQDRLQSPAASKLSLLKILRHFAVYTGQKQDHMTYLLKLLKMHEPDPYYSMLPRTRKELVKIDGLDFKPNQASRKMPPATQVDTGKYIHFGLESGLNGESAGIVHRDSDLLQFVDLYVEEPCLVPSPILKRVNCHFKLVICNTTNSFIYLLLF